MMLMGDEYGHTRYGNNNSYGHDTALNHFLWGQVFVMSLTFLMYSRSSYNNYSCFWFVVRGTEEGSLQIFL